MFIRMTFKLMVLVLLVSLNSTVIAESKPGETDFGEIKSNINAAKSLLEILDIVEFEVKNNPEYKNVLKIISLAVSISPVEYAPAIAAQVARIFPTRAQDISNAAARAQIDASSAIAKAVALAIGKSIEEVLVLKPFIQKKIIPLEPEEPTLESIASPQ